MNLGIGVGWLLVDSYLFEFSLLLSPFEDGIATGNETAFPGSECSDAACRVLGCLISAGSLSRYV